MLDKGCKNKSKGFSRLLWAVNFMMELGISVLVLKYFQQSSENKFRLCFGLSGLQGG